MFKAISSFFKKCKQDEPPVIQSHPTPPNPDFQISEFRVVGFTI